MKRAQTNVRTARWNWPHRWSHIKPTTALLLTIYLGFCFMRYLMFATVHEPFVLSDEAIYRWMAFVFHNTGDFFSTKLFPLYPNYLYQVLISPFYFFKEDLSWMKVLNSLLINSIVFPSFLMMKEFISARKSCLFSALLLALPMINIGNQIMPESAFYPLFMWSTYFFFKFVSEQKSKFAIGTGVSLALLFLTKPHALASILFFAMILVAQMIKDARRPWKWKPTLGMIGLSILLFLLVTILANYLIYKQVAISYLSIGNSIYTSDTSVMKLLSPDLFQQILSASFYRLLLGHLAPLLLIYAFPFTITLLMLFQIIQTGDKKKTLFLVIGLGQFIVSFLLAIKYSVEIGHFTRVHARYYSITLPFFIIACACFFDSIRWTARKRIILGILGLFTIVINIIFFLRYVPDRFLTGSIADNPDTSWFRYFPQVPLTRILFLFLFFSFALLIFRSLLRRQPSQMPYYVFLCAFAIISNGGHIGAMAALENSMSHMKGTRIAVKQVIQTMHMPTVNTAIVWPTREAIDNFSFWYPEIKAKYLQLTSGNSLTNEMIPYSTTVVILVGEYDYKAIIGPRDKIKKLYSEQLTVVLKKKTRGLRTPQAIYAHNFSSGSWRNGVFSKTGRMFFIVCKKNTLPPIVIGSKLRFASAGWATVLNLAPMKNSNYLALYITVDKKLDPEADGYPNPIDLQR